MGGIQRGRETDKKKEEEWGHFLPEEVLSTETTFLNKTGAYAVFS